MSSETQPHLHNTNDLQTAGRTIVRWTQFYDLFARVISLGHDGALRRETVERAGVQPGDQVLDVGCGTGSLTLATARQVGMTGQVTGIDASPEMIQVSTRKAARVGAAVTFQTGLIERLTFPDQTFDVVLSSLMMHHLTDDLRRRGLLEIRRVLKPGGRVFIVDFSGQGGAGLHRLVGWRGHGARLAGPQAAAAPGAQDLPRLLNECGFADVTRGSMGLRGVDFAAGHAPR